MHTYADIDNDSGVARYDYGPTYIIVEFDDGSQYEYTNSSAGSNNIQTMISLAKSGDGLNAFINKNVKHDYSRKIR